MRNIFLFLKRYDYLLLFLLLETIAFFTLISHNNYHSSVFFNSLQEVSGTFHEGYTNTQRYFRLKKVNDSLVAENARLREILSSLFTGRNSSQGHYFDTGAKFVFTYIPAYVIRNSITESNNLITLNVGKKDNIEEGMGVVASNGVIGKVVGVSDNFALVQSVLNSDFRINAKIIESGEIGSINWEGRDPERITMNDIPSHTNIEEGQKIVVGPYSSSFPENYPIGVIDDFQIFEGESFYTVSVKLNTRMSRINYAYVLKREKLEEQLKLEESIDD